MGNFRTRSVLFELFHFLIKSKSPPWTLIPWNSVQSAPATSNLATLADTRKYQCFYWLKIPSCNFEITFNRDLDKGYNEVLNIISANGCRSDISGQAICDRCFSVLDEYASCVTRDVWFNRSFQKFIQKGPQATTDIVDFYQMSAH